ncbi:YY1-associated factor 2-like [Watersipora subatra]|uniref:YY1-associated factor 2-like n=1 Tax=Watersipora subatra TaxID=2589382 RepID=UPI00355BB8E5
MDTPSDKKGAGRPKRVVSKPTKEAANGWDCSVCTFNNSVEAFKCTMCDTRKGTSTRKPRTNQQQAIIHQVSLQQTKKEKSVKKPKFKRPARLKNIDRSTAHHMVVTAGDVTVIITDYKPKAMTDASTSGLDGSLADDMSLYGHGSDTDLSD